MMPVSSIPSGESLDQFWVRHRHEVRPIGEVHSMARDGRLPGVVELPKARGYRVVNADELLASIRIEKRGCGHLAGSSEGIMTCPELK